MQDILVPFVAEHLLYAIIAGSFAWGLVAGIAATWLIVHQAGAAERRRALRARLVGAH